MPIEHEEYAVDLWERSRRKIALWMKGQMFLGILIAILTYLVLSLLGIQYALLLAIIAGIMVLDTLWYFNCAYPSYFFFLSFWRNFERINGRWSLFNNSSV